MNVEHIRKFKKKELMGNSSQIIEDIKWTLFEDRNFEVSFQFKTWTGNSNSFIVKDKDGQEYRVIVEKES